MSEMSSQGAFLDMDTTPEIVKEPKVYYLGRTGDLSLGNPEGIPSKLAEATEAELVDYGQKLLDRLAQVTDARHCGCIDGRHCKHNGDGSAPEIRYRRVSGSGANFETALNSGASVLDTIDLEAPLEVMTDAVDEHVTRTTGFEKSAHQGGCGGLNGAIEDNEIIAQDPAVSAATRALSQHEAVAPAIETTFDTDSVETVSQRAGGTAALLSGKGWKGQAYVDRVVESEPAGVAVLEADDSTFHGHAEDAIAVVVGDKTVDMDNVFVWNLKASIDVARGLAGQRGEQGYKEALIAEFMKHLAVSSRLASDKTPVYIIAA